MAIPIVLLSREPAKERVLAVVDVPGHLPCGRVDAHQPAPVVVPGLVVGMAGQMGRITGGEIGDQHVAFVVDGIEGTHRRPSANRRATRNGSHSVGSSVNRKLIWSLAGSRKMSVTWVPNCAMPHCAQSRLIAATCWASSWRNMLWVRLMPCAL